VKNKGFNNITIEAIANATIEATTTLRRTSSSVRDRASIKVQIKLRADNESKAELDERTTRKI